MSKRGFVRFTRRNLSLVILAAALVPCCIWHPYENWPPIRWDGEGYHLWTYALLRGNVNFAQFMSEDVLNGSAEWPFGVYYSDPGRNFCHNKYAPGVAIVRLPVMVFLVDPASTAPPFPEREHYAVLAMAALALMGTAYFSLQSCRLIGLPEWQSQAATLAIVFGTGLFHYATFYASYSHIWSALGLSYLLFLGIRASFAADGRLPRMATWATVALLVLVRNTNCVAIAMMALGFAMLQWRRRVQQPLIARNLFLIAVGGAVGLAIHVALNSHAHGRLVWSSYAYNDEEFLWRRPMHYSVLMAYEQGLFPYYPVLFVVLGSGMFLRKTRLAAIGLMLLIAAFCGIFGYWHSWMLGAGFGHRGFVELMPLVIPLLAAILAGSPRWGQAILLPVLALAVLSTLELMAGFWRGTLPWEGANREAYYRHLFGDESCVGWIGRKFP